MNRFILFLILNANFLNGIMIQVGPRTRAKDLYLSVSNADLKKALTDAEQVVNLKPNKLNSYSKHNKTFFENLRTFKIDNSTKPVDTSFPRSVVRRAPSPHAHILHHPSGVRPIFEIDAESTAGLAENHHTGYSYDPPSIAHNDLSYKFDSNNVKGSCTPEEVVAAIEKLDRLLKPVLNPDGYNSSVHPPTNPVLALILSRYGRYLSGGSHSNVYSYMAVNNIHSAKPFGQYKHE